MQKLILWALSLCICFPLYAQDKPISLKEGQALEGYFIQQRHLSGFAHPIVSEGQFYFEKNKGLIWKTQKPFETKLVINADGITQFVDDQDTMTVSVKQFPALETLHQVLSLSMQGRWQEIDRLYGAGLTPSGTGWALNFQPEGDMPIQSISLQGDEFLNHLIIVKPEGDKDEIQFHDQQITEIK